MKLRRSRNVLYSQHIRLEEGCKVLVNLRPRLSHLNLLKLYFLTIEFYGELSALF